MKCPKCGAVQPDGREECSACGIVFGRWQPHAERPRTLTSKPVPTEETAQPIPVAFIVIAAFLILLAGLVWNKHRAATRATEPKANDMIDAMNNAQVARQKAQQKRDAAQQAAQQSQRAMKPIAPLALPSDLSAETIRSLLERCSFFSDTVLVTLPKSFRENLYTWTADRYPALPMALAEGFVAFDRRVDTRRRSAVDPLNPGETVNVKLNVPFSAQRTETDTEYQLDLGRRHIDTITPFEVRSDVVRVNIAWSIEQGAVADLAPEGKNRSGAANVLRNGNLWTVNAWRNRDRGESTNICQ